MLRPKIFIGLLVVFVLFLVGNIVYRSTLRESILSSGGLLAGETKKKGDSLEETSRLQLQDFYRVEMKDGKVAWEIKAKEAKYFAKAEVSHVNDAKLTLHQEDGSRVLVDSTVAKLFLKEGKLTSAELEGVINVTGSDGVLLKTTRALYDTKENNIKSSEAVHITGPTYELDAVGFVFDIESNDYILKSNVHSKFLPTRDNI